MAGKVDLRMRIPDEMPALELAEFVMHLQRSFQGQLDRGGEGDVVVFSVPEEWFSQASDYLKRVGFVPVS